MKKLLKELSIYQTHTPAKAGDSTIKVDEHIFPIRNDYVDDQILFTTNFKTVPNVLSLRGINCENVKNYLLENYRHEIKDIHYRMYLNPKKKNVNRNNVFVMMYDDLLINFYFEYSVIRLLYRDTESLKINQLIDAIYKFKVRNSSKKTKMSILIDTSDGIDIKSLEINKAIFNLTDNYNSDFQEVHKTILNRLSKKNDKGLVLLHGKPGTGKTSYIKYLITTINKEVIFLSPNMASAMTNPDLISILIDNPNSIIVIEDAENILIHRNKDDHSPVSAILNISDGLLGDGLNIQIICSFNTDISKIDDALLRKGRLIAKYEFKELEIEKAKLLSKKLGFNTEVKVPMTLGDIYNQKEKDYQKQDAKSSIGFKVSSS